MATAGGYGDGCTAMMTGGRESEMRGEDDDDQCSNNDGRSMRCSRGRHPGRRAHGGGVSAGHHGVAGIAQPMD